MKRDKITPIQYATLTFFLLTSFCMNSGYYLLIKINQNDSIFSILLGGILILLFQFFTFYLNKNHKDNILTTIRQKYSKFFQIILYILIFIIITITTIYSLSNLIHFLHYYVVKEVSVIIITITLTFTILYITSKGLCTITKISEISFYIYIFLLLFGFIGLIKYIDLANLKPLFTSNVNNWVTSSLVYFLSSIIPLFLLQIISKQEIEAPNKSKKYSYILIITFIIISLVQLILIISVLGIQLASIYQNADMIIYKKISFLNILERIEVLLAFLNILNNLFIIIMGTYFIKDIINSIIGRKKEHITLALIGIVLVLSSTFYTFNSEIYLSINIIILILYLILFLSHFGNKDSHH